MSIDTRDQHADDRRARRRTAAFDRRRSDHGGDHAQRAGRHHRRDEDQPHAHGLQHDHLRGAGLHRRPVRRRGQHDLHRAGPADVHPRPLRRHQGQARPLRQGGHPAGRHPAHQRLLHHGLAPEPHDLHPARLLARASWSGFASSMAHWQDVGGTLRGGPRGHLRGRPPDADRQDLPRGRAQRRAGRDHQDQRPLPRPGDGRLPRPDRRRSRPASGASCSSCSATAGTPWWAASSRSTAHSGEVARQAVRAIPDGVYEAESFMDDDGVRIGQRIPIHVQGRPWPATR